jgi:hypothetical protein
MKIKTETRLMEIDWRVNRRVVELMGMGLRGWGMIDWYFLRFMVSGWGGML